jgi:DNA-directed RNA polymerase specialized sigma24 family protein
VPVNEPTASSSWSAAEALFESSWPGMVRLATLLTGSLSVAEDLVQDTLARIGSSSFAVRDPTSYMRTAVVNACRSYNRRHRLEQRHATTLGSGVPDHPDELWDLLHRLPYRQRAAVVLRYYVDLPDNEIAGALGCRPATVRSLVQRALTKMRGELPT